MALNLISRGLKRSVDYLLQVGTQILTAKISSRGSSYPSELSIAFLLGHKFPEYDRRIHPFRGYKVALEAAERVAASVAERMGFAPSQGQVIQFLGMTAWSKYFIFLQECAAAPAASAALQQINNG